MKRTSTNKYRHRKLMMAVFVLCSIRGMEISDGGSNSSAGQTNQAECHVKDFKHFKEILPKISTNDISRMLNLQGCGNQPIGADTKEITKDKQKPMVVAIDVENVYVQGWGWQPQRIAVVDRYGGTLLDEIVSDWVEEHRFQAVAEESPLYVFDLIINRFRSDCKDELLDKLTEIDSENGDVWRKVMNKRDRQENGKLKEFIRNENGCAVRALRHKRNEERREVRHKTDDVVRLLVTKFGKPLEEIQRRIRALIDQYENLFFVGHNVKNDIRSLGMPDVDFKLLDTQLLYQNYGPDALQKPSLKLLAREELYWSVQETEPWMDSRREVTNQTAPGDNVKGMSLYGHSPLVDAQASMLLLLNKIVEIQRPRELPLDVRHSKELKTYVHVIMREMKNAWLNHIKQEGAEWTEWNEGQVLKDTATNPWQLGNDLTMASIFSESRKIKQEYIKDGYVAVSIPLVVDNTLNTQRRREYSSTTLDKQDFVYDMLVIRIDLLIIDSKGMSEKETKIKNAYSPNFRTIKLEQCFATDESTGPASIELHIKRHHDFLLLPFRVMLDITHNPGLCKVLKEKDAKYFIKEDPRLFFNRTIWSIPQWREFGECFLANNCRDDDRCFHFPNKQAYIQSLSCVPAWMKKLYKDVQKQDKKNAKKKATDTKRKKR